MKKIGRARKSSEPEVRIRFAKREDGVRAVYYSTRFVLGYRDQFGTPMLVTTDDELVDIFLKRRVAADVLADG
ncbi:MAG: hypothetical protein V1912_11415 [bacterium]